MTTHWLRDGPLTAATPEGSARWQLPTPRSLSPSASLRITCSAYAHVASSSCSPPCPPWALGLAQQVDLITGTRSQLTAPDVEAPKFDGGAIPYPDEGPASHFRRLG